MQQSASLTAGRTTCCTTNPQLIEVGLIESDTYATEWPCWCWRAAVKRLIYRSLILMLVPVSPNVCFCICTTKEILRFSVSKTVLLLINPKFCIFEINFSDKFDSHVSGGRSVCRGDSVSSVCRSSVECSALHCERGHCADDSSLPTQRHIPLRDTPRTTVRTRRLQVGCIYTGVGTYPANNHLTMTNTITKMHTLCSIDSREN